MCDENAVVYASCVRRWKRKSDYIEYSDKSLLMDSYIVHDQLCVCGMKSRKDEARRKSASYYPCHNLSQIEAATSSPLRRHFGYIHPRAVPPSPIKHQKKDCMATDPQGLAVLLVSLKVTAERNENQKTDPGIIAQRKVAKVKES